MNPNDCRGTVTSSPPRITVGMTSGRVLSLTRRRICPDTDTNLYICNTDVCTAVTIKENQQSINQRNIIQGCRQMQRLNIHSLEPSYTWIKKHTVDNQWSQKSFAKTGKEMYSETGEPNESTYFEVRWCWRWGSIQYRCFSHFDNCSSNDKDTGFVARLRP